MIYRSFNIDSYQTGKTKKFYGNIIDTQIYLVKKYGVSDWDKLIDLHSNEDLDNLVHFENTQEVKDYIDEVMITHAEYFV